MTAQLSSIELAKQGNSQEIALLITRTLKAKGIIAQASLKDECLRVTLESTHIPSQPAMVQCIRSSAIRFVEISSNT